MCKRYYDFMNEISSDELYEGLVNGLFSEKLPPIFTATIFLDYCKNMTGDFPVENDDYIVYRSIRNSGVPRLLGIPTPMSYERQCAVLRDNWSSIQTHFYNQTENQTYCISRIHIRKMNKSKNVFEMNYSDFMNDGNPELDLLIQDYQVSKYLVHADISNCFPSIYTHSIPWALVGRLEAKRNKGTKTWYNNIDIATRALKNNETHGLLIGPHSSNVLSEIILTSVDKALYALDYRYVRHIDDYSCYVDSVEKAEMFLKDLESVLREYDLYLNQKKTSIVKLPTGLDTDWKHQLSSLPFESMSGFVEYPQVNSYIDIALTFSVNNGNFAIMKYAIKRLSGLRLSNNAKMLASKRIMHMSIVYPFLLHIIEEYVFIPFDVDVIDIKSFSNAICKNAVKTNDYESYSYSLYFALRYGFSLDALDFEYVIDQKDPVLLVLAWLYYLMINHGKKDATQIKRMKKIARELLKDNMGKYWLFCYEALPQSCLNDEWKKLKQAGVSFIKSEFQNLSLNSKLDF